MHRTLLVLWLKIDLLIQWWPPAESLSIYRIVKDSSELCSCHTGDFAVDYNEVIGYMLQNRESLFGSFYSVYNPSPFLEVLYDRATKHIWLFDYKRASEIEPVYIETRAPKGAIGFAFLNALRSFIHRWAFRVGSISAMKRQIALLVRDFLTKKARLAPQILARLPLLLVEQLERTETVDAPKTIRSPRAVQYDSNRGEPTHLLA
jgi:hypothetical protein